MASWTEVSLCKSENRRELNLQGPEISKRIENGGFDTEIFNLSSLNYLSISKTCLTEIGEGLSKLGNLTTLVLHHNQLKTLPPVFDSLDKLKLLDASYNELDCIPDNLCQIASLETLNLSSNKIDSFPNMGSLKGLHYFNLSSNQLSALPDGLCDSSLVHLSTINCSGNSIDFIPPELSDLPHLNVLDLSSNKISEIPPELSECAKLKELLLQGNKLKDRRLGKLIDQCGTKSVIEYLATQLKKMQKESGKKDGKNKKKKKGKGQEDEEVPKNTLRVIHFQDSQGLTVHVKPHVLSVRQYIVCCIVKNLNMQEPPDMFKRFIALQTRLHDTVCQKRQFATLATHDLKKIKPSLEYTAAFPHDIKIVPLGKNKEVSADTLVDTLKKEAEDFRKEKKRNTISGIHKYLELLEGRVQYPCLYNGDRSVISFPPITNSDQTKISKETTDILVEVTSCTNLEVCKTVQDELLHKMLEMGIGSDLTSENAGGENANDTEESATAMPRLQRLVVEQVKIVDNEDSLKVLYPSRTDLNSPAYKVIRNYD